METLDLVLSNVKCGGCVSNIQNGLENVGGIESVEVNVENGNAKITGAALDQGAILAKLAEIGYPSNS